jgi:hypothetical protein
VTAASGTEGQVRLIRPSFTVPNIAVAVDQILSCHSEMRW